MFRLFSFIVYYLWQDYDEDNNQHQSISSAGITNLNKHYDSGFVVHFITVNLPVSLFLSHFLSILFLHLSHFLSILFLHSILLSIYSLSPFYLTFYLFSFSPFYLTFYLCSILSHFLSIPFLHSISLLSILFLHSISLSIHSLSPFYLTIYLFSFSILSHLSSPFLSLQRRGCLPCLRMQLNM